MGDDIRIAFVGDSLVAGTGDPEALGWVGRLCARAMAAGADLTAYNLGVRRETSEAIRHRWADECRRRLPAAADGRVVFAFGVNDTVIEDGRQRVAPARSRDNLAAMLAEAAADYRLLVVGPPPVDDAAQNRRIAALSRDYAATAAAADVPFIGLFESLVDDPAYRRAVAANDGAHPRAEGYAAIAALVGGSPAWWLR